MNSKIQLIDNLTLIKLFYKYKLNISSNAQSYADSATEICKDLFYALENTSIDDIISIIKEDFIAFEIKSYDVPQFSDLNICCYKIIEALICSGLESIDFETMGKLLRKKDGKIGANIKYGENQAKTAAQMSLCYIENGQIRPTLLGTEFYKLPDNKKRPIATRLLLRLPLIQNYYASNENIKVIMNDISILKESTQTRRLSSIHNIIDRINTER